MDSDKRTRVAKKAGRREQELRSKELMRDFLLGYRDWMEIALRREKLTLPQLRMLNAVAESGGQSAASIARTCQVTPQTLQAMLQRAVREKWIVRRHSEQNQRILAALLTPQGKAILARGKALSDELSALIWKGTNAARLRECNEVLELGVESLRAAVEEQSKTAPRGFRSK